MMKKGLSIFLIVIPFVMFAQKEVGYLVSDNDEKIIFYKNPTGEEVRSNNNVLKGDVNLTAQYVHYFNAEGKHKKFAQSKVAEIKFDNREYLKLPIGSLGAERLQEVIAQNDEYLLTNYYHKAYYFFVFRKDEMKMEEKLQNHSNRMNKDLKLLEKKIEPYFKTCPELIKRIEKGIEDSNYKHEVIDDVIIVKNNLFRYVSNFQCAN